MIELTSSEWKGALLFHIDHIAVIRVDHGQTFVLTSTGIEYAVNESPEDIKSLIASDQDQPS